MTRQLSNVLSKEDTKELAHKALSEVLQKSGKPKSIKLKIKFGSKDNEGKKKHKSNKPSHTAGVKG